MIRTTIKRLLLTLAAGGCFVVAATAQKAAVSGRVTDAEGAPIVSATVLAYADSLLTPPMKGYAVTGGNGSFSLTVDGTAWIQVKSLGYADCVRRVAPGESGVDVKLEADGKTLTELVVKGSYAGVKVSGDTVRFDTDHFKTGAEDNIADVLRRLPGVDVSDDGHITYEGRGVSTLLVDGRDVFARGSEGTAVNNMSANIMTGAEILKNYAGYAVGNRYARGTGTALNIKTSGKHRLTGNADANGGLKDKYRGKGAAIYLGRSSSATALASANNTGEPVFTVSDYLNYVVGMDNLLAGGGGKFSLSGPEAMMVYTPDNVDKNHGATASVSYNRKPSDKLTVKANAMASTSATRERTASLDTYFAGGLVNRRTYEDSRRNNFATGSADVRWTPSWRFEMNSSSKFTYADFADDRDISNSGVTESRQLESTDYGNRRFDQTLSMRYDTGHGLLKAGATLSLSGKRQTFSLAADTLLFAGMAAAGEDGRLYSGRTAYDLITVNPTIGYTLRPADGYNIELGAAYRYDRNRITYIDGPAPAADHAVYNEFSAAAFAAKDNGLLRFRAGSAFVAGRYSPGGGRRARTYRKALPSLMVQLAFSQTHSLTVEATVDNETAGIDETAALTVVEGYDDIRTASLVTDPVAMNKNLKLSYNLFDLRSQTYITAMASYRRTDNLPVPCIQQDGLLAVTAYKDGGRKDNVMAVLFMQKGLVIVPADAKLNMSYSYVTNPSVVNGVENTTKSRLFSAELTLVSRAKGRFNGEVSAEYRRNANRIAAAGIKSHAADWGIKGVLLYASKAFKGRCYAGYRRADTPMQANSLLDVGFSAEYRIKNIGIKISGENLLNLDRYTWTDVYTSAYYSSESTYNRVPGNIMLGLTARF